MSEATRIIAIRHGETDWNVATRLQGHIDIPLNPTGRWQAESVARALAADPIDAIYSSDLLRALHTAEAIARLTLAGGPAAVQRDSGLRERRFGIFEGHTYEAISQQWPDAARRWKIREPDFAPEGGESPRELIQRIRNTVDALASRHLGQQIVLVAHGGVLDMLYRLATGLGVDAARTWALGNTAINRLLWTPQAMTLVGWGDSRHLEKPSLDEPGN